MALKRVSMCRRLIIRQFDYQPSGRALPQLRASNHRLESIAAAKNAGKVTIWLRNCYFSSTTFARLHVAPGPKINQPSGDSTLNGEIVSLWR